MAAQKVKFPKNTCKHCSKSNKHQRKPIRGANWKGTDFARFIAMK